LSGQTATLYHVFFCGSASTWVEENILKSTTFFGGILWYLEQMIPGQADDDLMKQ
jgi:hypothetical protein